MQAAVAAYVQYHGGRPEVVDVSGLRLSSESERTLVVTIDDGSSAINFVVRWDASNP
jgi:hypothetical protein